MENIIHLITPKKATYFLDENSTVRQALEKFDAHKFTTIPLLDENGKYKGTLSEGDILRFIKNNCNFDIKIAETVKISDIPHYRPYKSMRVDATFDEIYVLSLEQNFVPITDDYDTYIGIVKRKDVLLELKSITSK